MSSKTRKPAKEEKPSLWLRGWKLFLWLALTFVPVAIGYATMRVNLSVEPTVLLNPADPYKTQFNLKNENQFVSAYDIDSVCWPRSMDSGNGFSVRTLTPLAKLHHVTKSLEPGGSDTIDCPPVIGGIGAWSGQVTSAELEIVVSFGQWFWPLRRTSRYAFRAMQDTDKTVHWLHITPDEEKAILPSN